MIQKFLLKKYSNPEESLKKNILGLFFMLSFTAVFVIVYMIYDLIRMNIPFFSISLCWVLIIFISGLLLWLGYYNVSIFCMIVFFGTIIELRITLLPIFLSHSNWVLAPDTYFAFQALFLIAAGLFIIKKWYLYVFIVISFTNTILYNILHHQQNFLTYIGIYSPILFLIPVIMSYLIYSHKQHLSELAKKNRILLDEINHRVNNNLTTLGALIQIEMRENTKSKTEALQNIIGRIKAISQIHEQLYKTHHYTEIDISWYLEKLSNTLLTSSQKEDDIFSFHSAIEPIRLPIKVATNLGIITVELLTNTIKHSRAERKCHIYLKIYRKNHTLIYSFSNTGKGLPKEEQNRKDIEHGTGLFLIKEIAAEIGGKMNITHEHGLEFSMKFPQPKEAVIPGE